MHYSLTEKVYRIRTTPDRPLAAAVADHFAAGDYTALYRNFSLFRDGGTSGHPENEQLLRNVLGPDTLAAMRRAVERLYPSGLARSQRPEPPDLFVCKGTTSWFFCTVKGREDDTPLRPTQMVGISLINAFLGPRVEVAAVVDADDDRHVPPRTYQWVWPCVQDCGSVTMDVSHGRR